jgi:hypothetical protein
MAAAIFPIAAFAHNSFPAAPLDGVSFAH